ncbi:MAG: type 1 glutamine amidotransferase [Chlorobiaceae bacterium]|nr:type 1 glutamine amidotransferase [Chlorobiaceae bacterium]NTW74029.1 type 1 glutamine amidotransferase [Chlorobiaceae bacterium]
MSNQVLIVQNISHEGPGLLLDLLQEHRITFDLVDLSQGQRIPDPANHAAIVVLGGPQSANDTDETMRNLIERVREALDAGVPCLGICLGLQVMVIAAGGSVKRCADKEIGFHEPDGEPYTVTLTPEGRQDQLFNGLPDRLQVFQLHGETVQPAPGMTLLGWGKGCRNQVLKIGRNSWGLQCHFEMTRGMFEAWTRIDPDLMKMDRAGLLDDFDCISETYTRTGRTLLVNFLEAADLLHSNQITGT